MACRRSLTALARHRYSLIFSNPHSLQPLKTLTSHLPSLQRLPYNLSPKFDSHFLASRSFSSRLKNPKTPKIIDDGGEDEEDDDDDVTSEEDDGEIENTDGPTSGVNRAYSVEDKIKEAADIGYKVIGPLHPSDRVFKSYEPAFAVVQIGSHQFKVSNGDCIYAEKLKYCEVNDKIILNKVMMMGSPTQTIIGRPILPDAAVHAVVEEHALDAKVIIFKKRRRKNYRRTNGHRQELTRLRITDIQGIEKPETPSAGKKSLKSGNEVEKVVVAAGLGCS